MTNRNLDRWLLQRPLELDFWPLWNTIIKNNESQVLQDETGTQYLVINAELIMTAKDSLSGWNVGFMTTAEFVVNNDDASFLRTLKVAKTPYVLE